jgi:hypothetical protein
MVSTLRAPVLVLVLCVVALAAPLCGQEIANWPAPATWEPAAEHGRFHTMEAITGPLPFIGVTPCRQYDSRNFTPLPQNTAREIVIIGVPCGIPRSAAAVSLNVTVFNILGQAGNAVLQVGTTSDPTTAWINYPPGQGQIGNAGTLPLTGAGSIFFRLQQGGGGSIDFTLDVNGYYGSPAADSTNVFLGPGAGNTTMSGFSNTGIGNSALAANSTGNNNTACGDSALFSNTTGGTNTASGTSALSNNTEGSNNTASGLGALGSNTTGSANIAIGALAGTNLTTGDSNIDIGNFGVAGESATIRIGRSLHTRAFLAGVRGVMTGVNNAVAVMIDSAGQLGTVSSSRRVKQDIEDMEEASEALMKLRPVTFRYKASLDPTGSRQHGLIAEEVAEVFPDLVVYEKDGQPETVRYHVLVPMLLNEVQKDRRTIAVLTARLERLEAMMSESVR